MTSSPPPTPTVNTAGSVPCRRWKRSSSARNAPNSDQEPQRSRGPDDRPTPPHRDEMNRKTAPGRDSAAPSSPAPVANRITATESPTKKACNGLLQQIGTSRTSGDVRLNPQSGPKGLDQVAVSNRDL